VKDLITKKALRPIRLVMSRVQEAAATTLQTWMRTILARKELAELRYLHFVNTDDLTKVNGSGIFIGSRGLLKHGKLVLSVTVAVLGMSLLVNMDDPRAHLSSGSNVMALSTSREPHGYADASSTGKGVAKLLSESMPTFWMETKKL
jgi:hypothetical protein